MRSRVPWSLPSRPRSLSEVVTLLVRYGRACITIDTRSLALFRVALGLIVAVEVLLRARNFSLFYTEDGLVPQELAVKHAGEGAFSVYHYTTDTTLIAGLFALQVLVALLLIVGYRTRTMTVVTFLLMVSLDHHNPLVLSYADTLLRLLLFWAIFLPLGERLSVDALTRGREPRRAVASVATLLAMGQMSYMYVRNGIHKLEGDQWLDGTATPLILARDDFTFLLGEYTHHFTPVLEYGTYLWTGMMLFGFLLIALPGRLRYPFLPMYFGGHLLFALTVRIGMFPHVAMAGLLLFLQPRLWDDAERLVAAFGIEPTRIHTRLLDSLGSLRQLPNGHLTPRQYRSDMYTAVLALVAVTVALMFVTSGMQFAGVVGDNPAHEQEVDRVASTFSIDQPDWTVFAPNPGTTDRYYVFPAQTADGELLDLYNERNMSWERPGDELQHQYGTYRERFYMNTIRRSDSDDLAPQLYADHLCETWAAEHDVEVTDINMWAIEETITMDTIQDHENRIHGERYLSRHSCEDDVETPAIVDRPPDS